MRLDTPGARTVPDPGALPDLGAGPPPGPAWSAPRRPGWAWLDALAARPRLVALAAVALAVIAFSGGWPGRLVLDGPGVALWLDLAIDHLRSGGRMPYWMPEMWSGSPAWALAPSFPTLVLVPAGWLFGAEAAVKLATLGAQIAGGWGAFVLAEALWGRRSVLLPAAAALLYALHPLVVSHGALFGHETSLWVIAATPWLAWSVRRTLQGGSLWWGVASGMLTAFAVLHQAEHAYGLALMCGFQWLLEVGRARTDRRRLAHIARQTLVVAGVATGLIAFWLLPFAALSRSFVLTPPEVVRSVLEDGLAAVLGNEPGTFLTRARSAPATVGFEQDLLTGNVYLSWVCLVPTFVTALLISRHDDDGHLTAILAAGAVGLWLSSAGTPLAGSGPAQRFQLAPFLLIGTFTGLLAGSAVRRVTSGRAAMALGLGAGAALLAVPYVTPFLELQRVIPLLDSVRFPRFYPVAALAVALGAVFPIRVLGPWLARRRPDAERAGTIAATALLLVAFAVDVLPYWGFYRVRPPEGEAAYRRAAGGVAAVGGDFRIATERFGDPRISRSLLANGFETSTGWPHPIASREVWRLSGEAVIAPPFYKEAALGLSGTAYLAMEQYDPADRHQARVTGVQLRRNPWALPLVRAYRRAVVVRDGSITPELAVSLAQRNVAVVAGGPERAAAMAGLQPEVVDAPDACTGGFTATQAVANEVAMACALHNWVGIFAPYDIKGVGGGLGGVFHSPVAGLHGIGVWLDRPPGATVLTLHEVGPDGELGDHVLDATSSVSDWDENGLHAFRFEPLAGSAGKRYAFSLSCRRCLPTDEPRLVATQAPRSGGTLTQGGRLLSDRGAAFSLLYDDLPPADPADTELRATELGPGRWRISASGSHPALVVVAEAWFPGWRATVDGRPAPVVPADGAFVGVAVEPGEHTIELTYHPPPARAVGRLITGATLAVLAVAALAGRRRKAAGGTG